MNFELTPYAIASACTAAVAAVVALLAWRRRRVAGGAWLALLMTAVAMWAGAYVFEYAAVGLPAKLLWAKLEFVGGATAPVFFLLLALQYNGFETWLTKRNVALLFVVPAVALGLAFTNEWHNLIWTSVALSGTGTNLAVYSHGPGYWILTIGYSYLVILAATVLFTWAIFRFPAVYRPQALTIMLGALAPWAGNLVYVTGLSPVPGLDLTPPILVFSGVMFAWNIVRFRLLDLTPVAREAIVENMPDGMLVLDEQCQMVDINPAAQTMLHVTAAQMLGRPALEALEPWPPLAQVCVGPAGHLEIRLEGAEPSEARDIDVLHTLLPVRPRSAPGHVLMLRDVTRRAEAERQRRQAEDELRLNETRLRSLLKISQQETPALQALLDLVLGEALALSGSRLGAIYNFSELRQEFGCAARSPSADAASPAEAFPMNCPVDQAGPWAEVVRQRRALVVNDVTGVAPSARGLWGQLALRRFMIVPVFTDGQLVAVVGVANKATDYTSQDERQLAAMTQGAWLIVTRRQTEAALRDSQRKYQQLVETMQEGLCMVNPEGRILFVNQRMADLLSYAPLDLLGRSLFDFLERGWEEQVDVRFHRKDGTGLVTTLVTSPVTDDAGNNQGTLFGVIDVTERRQMEDKLHDLSLVDELTGLQNRRGFLMLAKQALNIADRLKQGMALLYVDLDRMKWINDTYGHQAGDDALVDATRVFQTTLRASDIIARIGGDEFAVLLLETRDNSSEDIVARLTANLSEHNRRAARPYPLELSYGVAYYNPEKPCSLEQLLDQGDQLMYTQKQLKATRRAAS